MPKEVILVKYPLCGWQHVPLKKGSKRLLRGEAVDGQVREFSFEKVDLDRDAFFSIREAQGKGKGFREVGRITLVEAVERKIEPELINQLKNQCQKILEIIG